MYNLWSVPGAGPSAPEQLLRLAPLYSAVTVLRCIIHQRQGGRFELWLMSAADESQQPQFLLSAHQRGFATYSISLRRPPGSLPEAVRSESDCGSSGDHTHPISKKRIVKKPFIPDAELEVARLVGDCLRTSYTLQAIDKPWIRRGLSGYNLMSAQASSETCHAAIKGHPKIDTSLIRQPLFTAHYSIRLNGLLTPRR